MIGIKKIAMVMIAATAVASAAKADTVVYDTSGSFSYNGTNIVSVGSGDNTVSLTFTGVSSQPATLGATGAADLGTFAFALNADMNVNTEDLANELNGYTFTLSITQDSPPVNGTNSNTVSASTNVSGHIEVVDTGFDTYSFQVLFSGNTASIPPSLVAPVFTYIPNDFTIGGVVNNDSMGSRQYTQSQNLTGTVIQTAGANLTPLPASVFGGTALLGLLAASKIRSRKIA